MLTLIGSKPSAITDTLFKLEVNDTIQRSQWGALLIDVSEDGKCMQVEINIPATAIIGRYNVAVEIQSETSDGDKTVKKDQPDVIVIFNPFCPGLLQEKIKFCNSNTLMQIIVTFCKLYSFNNNSLSFQRMMYTFQMKNTRKSMC